VPVKLVLEDAMAHGSSRRKQDLYGVREGKKRLRNHKPGEQLRLGLIALQSAARSVQISR
jgi:hypothetical protein